MRKTTNNLARPDASAWRAVVRRNIRVVGVSRPPRTARPLSNLEIEALPVDLQGLVGPGQPYRQVSMTTGGDYRFHRDRRSFDDIRLGRGERRARGVQYIARVVQWQGVPGCPSARIAEKILFEPDEPPASKMHEGR